MRRLLHFMDWPLRVKMAALLVVASILPLGIATLINIHEARERLRANTADLLAARADHLAAEIDTFQRSYQHSVERVAHLPSVVEFCQARPSDLRRFRSAVRGVLEVWPASDTNIRGIAILDLSGTVRIATEDQLIGLNLSSHSYVREALRGAAVISDIHFAESQVGYVPTIAYLAPVLGPDLKLVGTVVLWTRASSLWDLMKASNELAGSGSFAVLFDHQGIRIAHTHNDDIVFHPGGRLEPATVDALVAESRFGEKTRALLEDVRIFPEQFERALAESPGRAVFRGLAPVNQKWNYGVARRFETVPWTVFYMIPEESINDQIAVMTRQEYVFASVIILMALLAGSFFAAVILKPIRALSTATELIAGGDLAARVEAGRADELGRLGLSFNSMAAQIGVQATALQKARDQLALQVQERTAELTQKSRDLEIEIVERERLAAIAEYSDDAIISKDLDGTIVSWNVAAERMFGYSRQEMVGKPLALIIPPDRIAEEQRILAQMTRGEIVEHFETVRSAKDGKSIDVSVTISPIRDRDGRIIGASKIARDITQRKRAEVALDGERNLLRTVIDLLPDYIYVKDTQSRFLACNEACAQLMGASAPAELTGKTDADFYPATKVAKFRADELAVLEGTPQINKEEPFTHPDGTREFIVTTKLPIKDSSGRVSGLVGYGRNVTASRRAEEALQASEERYRTLFECAPDGIVIADPQSYYLDANATICRMLGYTRDELVGLHASDIVTETEVQHIGTALSALKARSDYHREWQFRRKDGSVFAAEVIAAMMPDGNLLGVIRDITERRRVERAAHQSEDRLDFALQVSETGSWDLDLCDHTAYRSLQHDRIFGYQTLLPTWTYEMFLDHVLLEDRHQVDHLFSQAIADKGDWSVECRIRRFDGEIRWIWASGRHRFDESGVPRRISGIVQDITKRKCAELEILKLNEELEQRVAERTAQLLASNKELEAFSYSVSHDLRAPLRHINGFSQALLEDYAEKLDEVGKGYLQEVRGATREMAQLIDDVLQLARVTRSEMHREVVNLSELAQSVVAELRSGDAQRIVAVQIEERLWTHGDKRLLRILLSNLLGNAWKFTSRQEKPEISFGHEQQEGETVYVVRDNGAGFDMTYGNKLFGAFQRLHTADEFEGTGIGLATVQRVINRHGGRVWAAGTVNQGAIFSFTFADFKGE